MKYLDSENLIYELKQKKESAFIELVNSYKKKVASLCFSYTEDVHEAEDLSQEVFISVFNHINGFRGECSLSTYIYRITISKCIDYKRKKSIKSFLTGLVQLEKSEETDLDDKYFVRQSINELSKDMKTVVILYYYIGLSYKEIGDILNISTKAVEGKLYRAKQKLKLKLEKGGYSTCSKSGII